MSIYKHLTPIYRGYEVTLKPEDYFSKRYSKRLSVDLGYETDGATGYFDLDSYFWLWHDVATDTYTWSDGSRCGNLQASFVAFDILWSENRYIHAPIVFVGVLVYGFLEQNYKRLTA